MRIALRAAFAALLAVGMAAARAGDDNGEEFSEVEYYANLERERLANGQPQPEPYREPPVYRIENCEDARDGGVFVALPQYFNSRAGGADGFKRNGIRLKSRESRANGMGMTAGFTRRFTDFFSLGIMYQYAFLSVRGGMAVEDLPALEGRERSRRYSHGVGLTPEFDFRRWGRLQLGGIQYFQGSGGD